MQSNTRKDLAVAGFITMIVAVLMGVMALFLKKHVKAVTVSAFVLLTISSVLTYIAVIDGYNNQGDFNSALRKSAPGATDEQYRCANNIIAASVMDFLSEPGLNNIYNQAVDQAKNGAKCDEGVLDMYGVCTGAAGTCGDGLVKKQKCGSGCKFTSLKSALHELINALSGGGKPNLPVPGTLGGSCIQSSSPDLEPFCNTGLKCTGGVCTN